MADRFYAPVPFDTATIDLSRDESQHLTGVLRKSPGDVVEVFDGQGQAAEAVVETADKRSTRLRIVRRLPTTLAVSRSIELATAPAGSSKKRLNSEPTPGPRCS